MTDHDLALVDRIRDAAASEVVEADDPAAVARALVEAGARSVPPSDVAAWAAEARELRLLAEAVLAAEELVDRARSAEAVRRRALLDGSAADTPASDHPAPSADEPDDHGGQDEDDEDDEDAEDDEDDDGPDADRAAVRFALVVLGLAQVGGVAVYLADGLLLAVAAPALAMAGVVTVAIAHRRPWGVRRSGGGNGSGVELAPEPDRGSEPAPTLGPEVETPGTGVPEPPVVRAARAHLRRQQAAWKAAWWQRGLAPGDVTGWVGPASASAPPATLVVADPGGDVDDALVATLAAAVPATVRVVVVRGRPA